MSKGKIDQSIDTKLSKFVAQKQQHIESEKHGFITPNKSKLLTKSFKLSTLDLETLNAVVQNINKESHYKNYSVSEVLRAFIYMGSSSNTKKLLNILRMHG